MGRRRRGRWWRERAKNEADEVGRRKRMKRVGRKELWCVWCVCVCVGGGGDHSAA